MLQLTDELYETMIRRDSNFDGKLYIAIVSTGIVCFPSCRSRLPRRENVRVYESVAEALSAGFRPCKRCKPDDETRWTPETEIVRQVCEVIEKRHHERLTLQTIAEELTVSPYHLQRVFKRVAGISPAKKLEQVRMEAAKSLLLETPCSIREVATRVGFQTSSHFSQVFREAVGQTPAEFRRLNNVKEETNQ